MQLRSLSQKCLCSAVLAIGLTSAPVWAINKCIDTHGRVTYQEKECPGEGTKLDIKESKDDVYGGSGAYYGGGYSGSTRSRGRGSVYTGPRGGQYTVSPSGNKSYISRGKR